MLRTLSAFGIQSSHSRSSTNAVHPYSTALMSVGCAVLVLLLFSCGSTPLMRPEIPLEQSVLPLQYSLVFIIHGDGDYLYHDQRGNARKADEEALIGATMVALRNPQAEVFIFHEKPRKHHWLFFPVRDGEFYYFRRGQLIANESYWHDQRESRFDPEVDLYHQFREKEDAKLTKAFLYFGHEIPEIDGLGYDASYPDQRFTIQDLGNGLQQMTRDTTKFDLLVLSTCYGGTPHTVSALTPYTRTIVASPDNLHLSYFNLHPFEQLNIGPEGASVAEFAHYFAEQTFQRLTADVQTAVSIAVYDVNSVQGYLNAAVPVYDQTVSTMIDQTTGFVKHVDCGEVPLYVLPGMNEGVTVFYRSARFGRLKDKQNHSGWECTERLN